MKRLSLFIAAIAALLASCTADDTTTVSREQFSPEKSAFYIAGEALGTAMLEEGALPAAEYRMNEGMTTSLSTPQRVGMYEKYVALEAGKPFVLALAVDGAIARYYGAELAGYAARNEIGGVLTVLRGQMVEAESAEEATGMVVEQSGLYHIVADLDIARDVRYPMVLAIPVNWGVTGLNDDSQWRKMDCSAFDPQTLVWSADCKTLRKGGFKLLNNNCSSLAIDGDGSPMVHTSLGEGMTPSGGNITIDKSYRDAVLTLTWQLGDGATEDIFSHAISGTEAVLDPKEFEVGFSGPAVGGWDGVHGNLACDETASKVLNLETLAGSYVYTAEGVAFAEGQFKVRYDGGYYGPDDTPKPVIVGMPALGQAKDEMQVNNFNVAASDAGTYDIELRVEYDGTKASGITVILSQNGVVNVTDPAEFKLGFSGDAFGSWDVISGIGALDTEKSEVTDELFKSGVYVYTAENVSLLPGAFKVRFNDEWWGDDKGFVTLDGLDYSLTDDWQKNYSIDASQAGLYTLTYTLTYEDLVIKSLEIEFRKVGDVEIPLANGLYIEGEAVGAEVSAAHAIPLSNNQYSKYIALQGGKPFTVTSYADGSVTQYGATLTAYSAEGAPTGSLTGVPASGTGAAAMEVDQDGLYHIILTADLSKLLVVPVKWAIRGSMNGWGSDEMTISQFSAETITWTKVYDELEPSNFKFGYGDQWKFSFEGVEYKSNFDKTYNFDGQEVIDIKKMSDVTITLTWTAATGKYLYKVEGTEPEGTPTDLVKQTLAGLAGNCFVEAGDWKDIPAVWDSCNVTDESNGAGTYVYKIDDITVKAAGGSFKGRFAADWFGSQRCALSGITGTASSDGDSDIALDASQAGSYSVVITVVYDGAKATSFAAAFTKK